MSAPLVYKASALRKDYGRAFTLAIDDLQVRRGEILGLVGPTGSGKSTLLRLLHLLEAPTSGELEFEGRRVVHPADLSIRRRITMVFQRPQLLRGTVLDNVCYGGGLRGLRDEEKAREILASLDLEHLADAPAFPLSGGEIQRVAVARSFALGCPVLLLDEPTANLDPAHVLLIERIILELREKASVTTVIVTHNLPQARRLADRVALLLEGRLVEVAETDAFFDRSQDPRTKAFLRGDMVW
ncbi:MAG TPA: ATP-binding cassette domain-containing protein [Anaerolineales bacterium]|nr:ATP-binding cassette domain-containing protein [Anaerolineales bacterium]